MTRWGYTVVGNSVILYQSGSECAHFSLFGGCWVGIPCSFITWRPAAILRGMWSATTAHSYTQKQGVGVDRGLFQWALSLFNLLAFLLDPTPWQEEKKKSDNLTQHSLWRQSRITVVLERPKLLRSGSSESWSREVYMQNRGSVTR